MNDATLKSLTDKALRYADMYGSEFPDKDHLRDLVNDGLSRLHDLIVNHNGEEYFRKDTTFSVSSSTESYTLPADFYKAIALYHQVSSRRHKIERWQPTEISGARTTPLSSGTVELWYVPQFKRLRKDRDPVSQVIPQGWENYAALYAASCLLNEEESDHSGIDSKIGAEQSRIIALLSPRDNAEPDSIGDFYGRWDHGVAAMSIEPSYKYRIMSDKIYFVELEDRGV